MVVARSLIRSLFSAKYTIAAAVIETTLGATLFHTEFLRGLGVKAERPRAAIGGWRALDTSNERDGTDCPTKRLVYDRLNEGWFNQKKSPKSRTIVGGRG